MAEKLSVGAFSKYVLKGCNGKHAHAFVLGVIIKDGRFYAQREYFCYTKNIRWLGKPAEIEVTINPTTGVLEIANPVLQVSPTEKSNLLGKADKIEAAKEPLSIPK